MRNWTDSRFRAAVLCALAAFIISGGLLAWSDGGLKRDNYPRSQRLQWVSSPSVAACVVQEWGDHYKGAVARGILIDTFAFIPAYVALLALCCFWCAKHLDDDQIRRAAVRLGFVAVIAGVLDLIENAGMLVQLYAHWFRVAPVTAAAADLKWVLVTIIELFVIGVFLQRRRLFNT
jgi:hypothetical protein